MRKRKKLVFYTEVLSKLHVIDKEQKQQILYRLGK